jgi:hypothetical protein
MSVTESLETRNLPLSNDGLEALGRTLQYAFPISECRSFRGLMQAIDAGREADENRAQPFLLQLD